MKRLYVWLCRRYAPGGLTLSALAWARFERTRNSYWRDRIDGALLFFRSERDHCQSVWERETDDLNP